MDILEYIKTRLIEQGIDDVRPGTAVRDLLVKPHILLMDPLIREIDRVRINQSLKNYALMDSDEMDLVVSNLLLERKVGLSATGTMRFQFSQPTTVIIPADTPVIDEDGKAYLTTEDVSATAAEMQYNIDGIFYYLDAPVESEAKDPDYNVVTLNNIYQSSLTYDTLSRVENITAISGAVKEETNEELYHNAKRAVGERTLLRDDGAYTILTREFPEILRMEIIGTGDPEMLRDIYMDIHVGGMVDHYIDTSSKAYTSKVFLNIPEEISIRRAVTGEDPAYLITDTPVLDVADVQVIDPITYDPTGEYLFRGPDYSLSVTPDKVEENYSVYQDMKIVFNAAHVGKSVKIFYVFNPTVSIIQDYVLDINNRVNNANHVIFNLLPAWLDITFSYRGAGTEAEVLAAVTDYILTTMRFEVTWENTDMVSYLYDTGLVNYIQKPYTVNIRVVHKGTIDSSAEIVSENTLEYLNIYYPGNISVTKL